MGDRAMRRRSFLGRAGLALGLTLLAGAAVAQRVENSWRTRLTSAAFEPQDRAFKGDGDVVVMLAGTTLSVTGHYEGLDTPAIRVRILSGPVVGARGDVAVADLAIPPAATTGAITGTLHLTRAQLALLKANRLYVQVETKGAPGGALWGWLMPNYRFPGEGVPEKQDWFAR